MAAITAVVAVPIQEAAALLRLAVVVIPTPRLRAVVAVEAVAGATVTAAAEATSQVAAATVADGDKLTLLISPTTGAAAGTSTQPAAAPAFLICLKVPSGVDGRCDFHGSNCARPGSIADLG